MGLLDSIAEHIKKDLPKLSDLFGKIPTEIEEINIENSRIYVKTLGNHGLKSHQKVFIQGVKLPISITGIEHIEGTTKYRISLDFYHHLIYTLTEFAEFEGFVPEEFNGLHKLALDEDGKTLIIDFGIDNGGVLPDDSGTLPDISNAYLVRYHSRIINGYHEIIVVDENTFMLDGFTLNYDIMIGKKYLEDANFSIGQRIYCCFDLENVINHYCGLIGTTMEALMGDSKDIVVKDEDKLTCYIEIDKRVENKDGKDVSEGVQLYNLNLYICVPLKNKSLNGGMYDNMETILKVVNIFNRILGNKSIPINLGLETKSTFPLVYKRSEEAGVRTNVLYIHKITYAFYLQTTSKDFIVEEDYLRFNRLKFDAPYKTGFDTNY